MERNQSFIDGGFFGMSLVYALHYLGLGTCCLHWSVNYKKDNKLRKLVKIKDSENILFMILVGHLPTKLKVAKSERIDLNDIMKIC